MFIENKIKSLGLILPETPPAIANYVAIQRCNELFFVSGQLPYFIQSDKKLTGKVGKDISLSQAIVCAQACALNSLSQAKHYLGDLDLITGIIKLTVFVAVDNNFYDIAKVANGASDLFVQLWSQSGRHARSAVGVAALPLNAPVEVEMIFTTRIASIEGAS